MHKVSNYRVGKKLHAYQSCSPASSLNKNHACNKGAELEMQAQECNE